jgi:hypothetical protein
LLGFRNVYDRPPDGFDAEFGESLTEPSVKSLCLLRSSNWFSSCAAPAVTVLLSLNRMSFGSGGGCTQFVPFQGLSSGQCMHLPFHRKKVGEQTLVSTIGPGAVAGWGIFTSLEPLAVVFVLIF